MPDNTLSTLEQIRVKVRRLTRSPSPAQLTDNEIDSYVNTFVLYDFPEHLRSFSLRTTMSFYIQPYIDSYTGNAIADNFNDKYTNVYSSSYVAGYAQQFFTDISEFYAINPKTENIVSIGVGDGITTNFTGTLSNVPVLRNHLSFTSIDDDDLGLEVHDVPNDPNDGEGTFDGDTGAAGSINYTSGVYDITFDVAPADGEYVYANSVPYSTGIPTMLLYYNNTLTFRPVPDKPYRVELEVAMRPSELLTAASEPEMSQWWQYIAYGAAKKVFEDRMDMDSVQMITQEFKKQEILVQRRKIGRASCRERV